MKPKIKSINNIGDSIILYLEHGDESVKQLYDIFDIDNEFVGNIENYSELDGYCQPLDEKDYIVYIIYLATDIIIILRKVKKWEQKRDELMKIFEISSTKNNPEGVKNDKSEADIPKKPRENTVSQFGHSISLGTQEEFGYRIEGTGKNRKIVYLDNKKTKNRNKKETN